MCSLRTSLAALDQLKSQRQALAQQWQLRLERARYETSLARRRYERVNPSMIAAWFRSGFLSGSQRKPRSTLWVRFDDDTFLRLNGLHPLLPDMIPLPDAPQRLGVTIEQLRVTIRSGSLLPYRIFLNNYWHWFVRPALLAEPGPL